MRSKNDIITPWLTELLLEQAKENDVYVLTSGYAGVKSSQKYKSLKIIRFNYAPKNLMKLTHDLTIQDYIRSHPLSVLLLPSFFISGILKCLNTVKSEAIEVIIIHWPFPLFFIALPAKIIFGTKIVSVFYGAELKLFKNKFKNLGFLFRFICRKSDKTVAISNATAVEVRELSKINKVEVIPYGVRVKELKKNTKEKLILTVGRQVERKGTEYLIRAMKMADSSYKLVIVGDGPMLNHLKKTADFENLSNRVEFAGWIKGDILEEYYNKAKIFVLPAIFDSRGDTEGLGMVLVEAIMHGAVCIATGIGGITDIIKDNETGLLSKEKDEKDIAEKINLLIENDNLYDKIVKKGYMFVSVNFSVESVNRKYDEILKEVGT